jgi:hypothetical protein
MTLSRISNLIEKAATPGPWKVEPEAWVTPETPRDAWDWEVVNEEANGPGRIHVGLRDAEFIAHSRQLLPLMYEVVRASARLIEALDFEMYRIEDARVRYFDAANALADYAAQHLLEEEA